MRILTPPPTPVAKIFTGELISTSIPQASPLVPVAMPNNLIASALVLAEVIVVVLELLRAKRRPDP